MYPLSPARREAGIRTGCRASVVRSGLCRRSIVRSHEPRAISPRLAPEEGSDTRSRNPSGFPGDIHERGIAVDRPCVVQCARTWLCEAGHPVNGMTGVGCCVRCDGWFIGRPWGWGWPGHGGECGSDFLYIVVAGSVLSAAAPGMAFDSTDRPSQASAWPGVQAGPDTVPSALRPYERAA